MTIAAFEAIEAVEVTRTRFASGTWVDGTFVPGAGTDATVESVIHPVTAKTKLSERMLREIDLQRNSDWIVLYSALDTYVAGREQDQNTPDRIAFADAVWEVKMVDNWRASSTTRKPSHAECSPVQTLNDIEIQAGLCRALQAALWPGGSPTVMVVSAEQKAPRPTTDSFVDLRVGDYRQVGHGEVEGINDDGLTPITGHYEIEVRFRAVGTTAKQVAHEIQFALANRPDVLETIEEDVGMTYVRETETVHVPVLVDNRFEPRTQFVVTFHAPISKLVDLGYIASIENVALTFEGGINPLTVDSGEIDITT
jgi:hypothetical protein